MSCCIERAVLDALRSLTCTPIKSENHFIDQRECENCVPYLVLKAGNTTGLRTSDGIQDIWNIDIKVYFAETKKQMARDYRDLVKEFLTVNPCVDLGACGCFCINGAITATIRNVNSEIVYSCAFRGSYNQALVLSESA